MRIQRREFVCGFPNSHDKCWTTMRVGSQTRARVTTVINSLILVWMSMKWETLKFLLAWSNVILLLQSRKYKLESFNGFTCCVTCYIIITLYLKYECYAYHFILCMHAFFVGCTKEFVLKLFLIRYLCFNASKGIEVTRTANKELLSKMVPLYNDSY